MPFNLGAPELIIVLLVFILLFGARKLPDLGSSVGKSIRNFRKGMDEAREEERAEAAEERAEAAGDRDEAKVPPTTPPSS